MNIGSRVDRDSRTEITDSPTTEKETVHVSNRSDRRTVQKILSNPMIFAKVVEKRIK